LARFAFFAVLFFYYIHSATLKVGSGIAGFFQLEFGAFIQILGEARLAEFDFDAANVPFFPDYLIVFLGSYMEFILPILIVIGLFTRAASLGMIGFIVVQSVTDVTVHNVDEKTLGAWFDRFSDSLIMDQRLLWVTILLFLVIKGAGYLSVDALLNLKFKPSDKIHY